MAERIYTKEVQDTLNTRAKVIEALKLGIDPNVYERLASIDESKITAFCKGCDNFKGEGIPCETVGSNDQARYAVRNWCGWATVNGVRTVITGE